MRYIGCKTLLLENIKDIIDKHTNDADSFCDIFSGTATVARYFKNRYKIFSNDVLFFSYCSKPCVLHSQRARQKESKNMKCEKCGKTIKQHSAENDDIDTIISISSNPDFIFGK